MNAIKQFPVLMAKQQQKQQQQLMRLRHNIDLNLSKQQQEYQQAKPARPDPHTKWRASTLQRTKMSDFIELMVTERLRASGFGDYASSVSVRLTSNTPQTAEVPEPICANMMTATGEFIPPSIHFNQKCVLLFQSIDGVDVCLFSLYVQVVYLNILFACDL